MSESLSICNTQALLSDWRETFATLVSRHGESVAEDVDVVRRIFRKCPVGCTEIVTVEQADTAVASVLRIRTNVLCWFRDRIARPFAQIELRSVPGLRHSERAVLWRSSHSTTPRCCARH